MITFLKIVLLLGGGIVANLTPASYCIESLNNQFFEERGERLFYQAKPFTGVRIENFPNGQTFRETHYQRGLKEGESKEFATNGALRARWNFHSGKKHGFQQGWYIEGPKRFEFRFKNGILDGVQSEWHLNGSPFRQQVYVNGVETDRKILFPTAEVFSNFKKRAGRIFGLDGGALCFEKKKEGEK